MKNNTNMQNSNQQMNSAQANPYYNSNMGGNTQGSMGMKGGRNSGMNNNMNMGMQQNPYITQTSQNASTGFSTAEILTGALLGAAATYVLTNENVQKTLFKGALSVTDILSGGLDEMKERFEDAKAEREAAKEA